MATVEIKRIVVASPRDVQAERNALPTVVEELNHGIAKDCGLRLELARWETDAYPGFHPEGPQGLIDDILRIEDCDILIGIFWKRFGTPTQDAKSGTEHEFRRAYGAWQQHRRPHIMMYFNQRSYTPKTKAEAEQWGQVLDFREHFPKEGLWWPYRGRVEFERLVRRHLTQFIRQHIAQPDGKQTPLVSMTPTQSREGPALTHQPFEPEMILIPAGEFLMGSDPQQDEDAHVSEHPQHRLSLPDYYLAKTPVTNAQYSTFVRATGREAPEGWDWVYHTPPSGQEDHPVVHVSWYDAVDYCQWLSEVTGRVYNLPSEAEWEKGARGPDNRIFPWGDQWDATRCNAGESGLKETTPVHAYPQGVSPYGLLDMTGNVWEWTRSLWGKFPYPTDQPEKAWRENLKAARTILRVLRGGAFHGFRRDVRCDSRRGDYPSNSGINIGFRVVMHP